jgi:hypothetical protein
VTRIEHRRVGRGGILVAMAVTRRDVLRLVVASWTAGCARWRERGLAEATAVLEPDARSFVVAVAAAARHADARVEVRAHGSQVERVRVPIADGLGAARIEGLAPDTAYEVAIELGGDRIEHRVRTAQRPDDPAAQREAAFESAPLSKPAEGLSLVASRWLVTPGWRLNGKVSSVHCSGRSARLMRQASAAYWLACHCARSRRARRCLSVRAVTRQPCCSTRRAVPSVAGAWHRRGPDGTGASRLRTDPSRR